jgi:hypothetical protein
MAPSVATSPKKRKEIASCGKEEGKKSGCKPRVLGLRRRKGIKVGTRVATYVSDIAVSPLI